MKNLFKRTFAFSVALCLTAILFVGTVCAKNTDTIIILYENDVHCAVEGYSKLAAMKKELLQTYAYVGAVSCGDYIQGSSLGAVSKGEYIVELMNLVGYDAVTLGNHEFDYRIDRLNQLADMMDTKPVCCNFQKTGASQSYFQPYKIVSYGETRVAYIGITTPDTLSSSSPAQFKDENGNYIYTFNVEKLYDVVQKSIDSAKQAGADYVVALSHLGYGEDASVVDIVELVSNTAGFDVVLDGHSHSVIENMKLTDGDGNEVILSSTGTKFANIGKLTISNGTVTTQLIRTEEYTETDAEVDTRIAEIQEEYASLGDRKIGVSEVDLITNDEDGNRLVRKQETNLGDLCSDAFRIVTGADIGYANGGGMRAPIAKGDITYNDMLSVFPFDNQIVVAKVSGRTIKDFLEMALMNWPSEDGSFPHVSGLTFSVNTSIEPSVTVDKNGMFTGVEGQYRVYDIKVLDKDSGEYKPLILDKEYTFASVNYYLLEYGGGLSMFEDAEILQKDGMLDDELLEKYIVEHLNGVIGQEYAQVRANITFTNGELTDIPKTGDNSYTAVCISVSLLSIFCLAVTAFRAKKFFLIQSNCNDL